MHLEIKGVHEIHALAECRHHVRKACGAEDAALVRETAVVAPVPEVLAVGKADIPRMLVTHAEIAGGNAIGEEGLDG